MVGWRGRIKHTLHDMILFKLILLSSLMFKIILRDLIELIVKEELYY